MHIPHEDWLVAMRKELDAPEDKTVSTDSLTELAECVLKNNIFEHNTSFYKQLRSTAIATKMAPTYAIIFRGDLEVWKHSYIFSNPSIQPGHECFLMTGMVNSCYGPYSLLLIYCMLVV